MYSVAIGYIDDTGSTITNTLRCMKGEVYMGLIRMIIGVLIVLWLLGFVLNIGGGLIHTLVVIAVILFIFDMVGGRRRGGI